MISYCLGFAFTDDDHFVVLIRKNKPAWQKGLLNGVGGKIDDYETAHDAMVREFREETGITHHHWTRVTQMNFQWKSFPTVRFAETVVHCFATRLPKGNDNLTQTTDEQVGLFSVTDARNHPKIIPNLRWLIPMALHALDNDDNSVPHTLDHK